MMDDRVFGLMLTDEYANSIANQQSKPVFRRKHRKSFCRGEGNSYIIWKQMSEIKIECSEIILT
ncbi:MAG: hypothetical protein K0R19_1868 [Bacillota bacterium]|jgi:hypothetical protein|nr:hypothetical protein [Bacillota bacterium]